jgi:hypothetical protein
MPPKKTSRKKLKKVRDDLRKGGDIISETVKLPPEPTSEKKQGAAKNTPVEKGQTFTLPTGCIWKIITQSVCPARGPMLHCRKGWPQENGTIEWGPEFKKPKTVTLKWLEQFPKK